MNYALRQATKEDEEFLYRLYATTREDIAAIGWNAAQQQAFLRMQFNAQHRWYQTAYSQADHQIIEHDGTPVGRIMVFPGDRVDLLVDISLLPEYRSHGIGTELIQKLVRKSRQAGKQVRLQVLKANPARILYQRLGFCVTGEDQLHLQMETAPEPKD